MFLCLVYKIKCVVDRRNIRRATRRVSESVDISLNIYIFWYFVVLCGKFGSPYLGKVGQSEEQRYPLLSVCAVFVCLNTAMAASGWDF